MTKVRLVSLDSEHLVQEDLLVIRVERDPVALLDSLA